MKVLAVVAHQDDMETHCGGIFEKYRKQGHTCAVIVTSDGSKGSMTLSPEETVAIRREEQRRACHVLGMQEPIFLDYPDNMMECSGALRLDLLDAIRKVDPDVIFTHFTEDGSTDHRTTAKAVMDCLIALRFPNMPVATPAMERAPSVFFFDSDGGIGFLPEIYIDITEEMDVKIRAFSEHRSQTEYDARYMQDVALLSRFRGYQCGVEYAEAFRAYHAFGFLPDYKKLP